MFPAKHPASLPSGISAGTKLCARLIGEIQKVNVMTPTLPAANER